MSMVDGRVHVVCTLFGRAKCFSSSFLCSEFCFASTHRNQSPTLPAFVHQHRLRRASIFPSAQPFECISAKVVISCNLKIDIAYLSEYYTLSVSPTLGPFA